MKKNLKVVFIALCGLICLNSLVGCNLFDSGEKEMIAYMDTIEPECKDYSCVDEKPAGYEYLSVKDGNIVVQDKNVSVEKIDYEKGYNIKIEETEIVLDVDYFIANSETFNKIVKLWDDYTTGSKNSEVGSFKVNVNHIEIDGLRLFDDQLFVYVCDQPGASIINWRGCVPLCAFRFDVTDYSLEYVGYSKEYHRRPYLVKN